MFFKVGGFKNFVTPMLESLFNTADEETPAQVISCEYCEIFKNNILYRTPPVAAFVSLIK